MAELRRVDLPRERRLLRMPRFDPEAFGRLSEGIARFMGTARFLVYMTVVIAIWLGWNTLAPRELRFDPYTFTFMTLVLSLQASYAAPLILLAQNRQADRDRVALEEDRRRAALQKEETEFLAREIAALRIALGEVATRDYLRSELNRLSEELAAANSGRGRGRKHEPRPRPAPDERPRARAMERAAGSGNERPVELPSPERAIERSRGRSHGDQAR